MSIHDCLSGLIAKKIGGDISRFDELWQLVPDLAQKLRSFDPDGRWLHWRTKTFDGWYCVGCADAGFEVWYQERGVREPGVLFSDEREAIRFALNAALIDLDSAPGA
jgi:hypothetical protein